MPWYRIQLHSHSYWSDGRGFIEQSARVHRREGYQVLCLSDHNRFGEQPAQWREVCESEGGWPPRVTQANVESLQRQAGPEALELRAREGRTEVRLKTFAEVKRQVDDPGTFLLTPGVEITHNLRGYNVHLNCLNLPGLIPALNGAKLNQSVPEADSVGALIAANAAQVTALAQAYKAPWLLMLNHPFWRYYDIAPQAVIDQPEIHLVEVCCGGSGGDHPPFPGAGTYTVERFWDIVNAFRLRRDLPLLYGTGSDDAHFFDDARFRGNGGVGGAWVMVRAAELTPEAWIGAMRAGDFYASTGVALDTVEFDAAKRSLRVKIRPEPGVRYRIRFITTPVNFDASLRELPVGAKDGRVRRVIPLADPAIGTIRESVQATEAVYAMRPEDLFVRARIESSRPARITGHFLPDRQLALTQPYR